MRITFRKPLVPLKLIVTHNPVYDIAYMHFDLYSQPFVPPPDRSTRSLSVLTPRAPFLRLKVRVEIVCRIEVTVLECGGLANNRLVSLVDTGLVLIMTWSKAVCGCDRCRHFLLDRTG